MNQNDETCKNYTRAGIEVNENIVEIYKPGHTKYKELKMGPRTNFGIYERKQVRVEFSLKHQGSNKLLETTVLNISVSCICSIVPKEMLKKINPRYDSVF